MTAAPRRPWIAVTLSMLYPGLGHLYCGRAVRSLVIALSSLIFSTLALLAATHVRGGTLSVLLGTAALVPVALSLFAVVDAWRIASGAPADVVLREYQRPLVYVLFVMTGLLSTVAVALVIRDRWFEAFKIASGSMDPTLRSGDCVLANKAMLRSSAPVRGDLVVFWRAEPGRARAAYVKRVVGLPGDGVEIREGRVLVNGTELPTEPAPGETGILREHSGNRSWRVRESSRNSPEARVPEDRYYLLGDNRSASYDSHVFGPVAREDLIGVIVYLYEAADGWRPIGPISGDE